MSFTRANPLGWTNLLDPLTPTQLNQIDVNISRALDGTSGGEYTSSSALTINGTAGVNITTSNNLRINGTLSMTGSQTNAAGIILTGNNAALRYRIYNAPDSDLTIQAGRYDIITIPSTLTGDRTYTLVATSPVPATGHLVRLVRSTTSIAITQSSGHKAMLDFGAVVTTDFQDAKWAYWVLMWDGSAWYPVEWSPTNIDLALAIEDSWQ